MRLAALLAPGSEGSRLHLETNDGYVSVDELAAASGMTQLRGLADVSALFSRGDEAVAALSALDPLEVAPVAGPVGFAPPVRRPSKIICVGLNYAAHVEESRTSRPERILLFSKYPSCLVGHEGTIELPAATRELDYEGELAVVIGRRAKGVQAEDALGFVGGFTIINDVTARDLQEAEPQWVRGKALDTFAPLGPVVVDTASAPPIRDMHIRTLVNGELRQDASCALMITPVPELIAYISAGITLEPGDIIATGTPAGVAFGMEHPVYLAEGDTVAVEIAGVGTLVSHIATARAQR